MYCTKCGTRNEDEALFCKQCGQRLRSEPLSEQMNPAQDNDEHNAENPQDGYLNLQNEDNETGEQDNAEERNRKKNNKKSKLILLSVAAIAVCLILFLMVVRSRNSAHTDVSDLQIYYALPEFPDYITMHLSGSSGSMVSAKGKLRKYVKISTAYDGTYAIQQEYDKDVQIFDINDTVLASIPAPVHYFMISGSGAKVIYGTNSENTYSFDVAEKKSTLIAEDRYARGVNFEGSIIYMSGDWRDSISKDNNKLRDLDIGHRILGMSEDGKCYYYNHAYTVGGLEIETKKSEFIVNYNGISKVVLSYSDPDYTGYIICHSQDYREILFGFRYDIYYFSLDEALKSGNYDPIRVIGAGRSVLRPLTRREIPSIRGGVYVLLSEDGNASLCMLSEDFRLETIAAEISGSIHSTPDETSIWCISSGRPTYIEVSDYDVVTTHADIHMSGRRFEYFYYLNPEEHQNGQLMAVTSDCNRAYFLDTNGTLWLCTPEIIKQPLLITDGAIMVKCSADDQTYVLKKHDIVFSENEKPRIGELYLVDASNELSYQRDNVADILFTKTNMYLIEAHSKDEQTLYSLYYKNGDAYSHISDNLSWWGDDESEIYWGNVH